MVPVMFKELISVFVQTVRISLTAPSSQKTVNRIFTEQNKSFLLIMAVEFVKLIHEIKFDSPFENSDSSFVFT